MSKIALITDTHFGARADSIAYDRFFEKFYTDVFFPELEARGITSIVHLGDVFDRRKFINYATLRSCKRYFFDQLESRGITAHVLAGNHDTFFKNTNEVNSPDILLREYNNIVTYSEPTVQMIEGRNILLMPWICADNYVAAIQLLKDKASSICFGHFELAGFVMHKGQVSEDGLDPNILKDYELVCSGHFHHRSTTGNIVYLGNPYEFTWVDYGDTRGFHVFDTEDASLEFIKNPYTIFEKIYYDDTKDDYSSVDVEQYRGKNIKLIVVNKSDYYVFDKFIDALYAVAPLELKIVEDFSEFESEVIDDSVNIEDTMSLLSSYVDAVETDMNKDKIKGMLKTLYVEAQTYNKDDR
jgi:DNA repair exonuclease SbcCD nuclease subunit